MHNVWRILQSLPSLSKGWIARGRSFRMRIRVCPHLPLHPVCTVRHPLLILASMALAACGSAERPPANDPPVRDSRGGVAEFSDASTLIRVRAGTDFVITIPSNATTGYQWALADSLNPALLRRVNNEYLADRQPAGSPPVAGAGGHERWTFRALAPGQATIRMIYVRPWEKEQAADTTTYRVIIQ